MTKKTINLFMLGIAVLTMALFGCSSGNTVSDTTAAGAAIDGVALYSADCQGCHGPIATSQKRGATVSQIQDAISMNWNGMGSYANLTIGQLQAIAAALSDPATLTLTTTTPTGTDTSSPSASLDGAALYTSHCQSCHRALASSTKLGRTAAQIQAAITNNLGSMGQYSTLTPAQIQAIADALATAQASNPGSTSAPGTGANSVDGAALYDQHCSGCHGLLAASTKAGRTAPQIQAAIANNIGGMNFLSNLTQSQVTAIAAALAPASGGSGGTTGGTTTSTDGAALYTQNCQGCHGPLASSTKAGRTAVQIQAAISNNTGGMGFLSPLTSTQIQSIATALSSPGSTPAPPPACGSCHAIPPATGQHSFHVNSQGYSCSTCHGTGYSSTSVNAATHMNGTVNLASTIGWNASTRSCSNSCHGTHSWGGTSTSPAPTPTTTDGATLYGQYCQGCHNPLASSTKAGRTAAQITAAIGSVGVMNSLSNLSATQIQAIATALSSPGSTPAPPPACGSCHAIPPATGQHSLHVNSQGYSCSTCHGTGYSSTSVNAATHQNGTVNLASTIGWNASTRSCSNSCHGTHYWGGTSTSPAPTPTTTDGATLYGQYCQGCHGPLASSSKAGRTTAQITAAITSNTGGMGTLSTLTTAQIQAIASALATATPSPTPTPACGSCHAIPPATGQHSRHVNSEGYSCSRCHGTGYSSTTVNAATHQNGTVNLVSTIGWNAATRSCSNSCHGTERW